MRDLPPKVRVNSQLQQVMLKSRLRTEIYDVGTFNTAFNTEAGRLIKIIENTAKYTYSDRSSANPSPYKK